MDIRLFILLELITLFINNEKNATSISETDYSLQVGLYEGLKSDYIVLIAKDNAITDEYVNYNLVENDLKFKENIRNVSNLTHPRKMLYYVCNFMYYRYDLYCEEIFKIHKLVIMGIKYISITNKR